MLGKVLTPFRWVGHLGTLPVLCVYGRIVVRMHITFPSRRRPRLRPSPRAFGYREERFMNFRNVHLHEKELILFAVGRRPPPRRCARMTYSKMALPLSSTGRGRAAKGGVTQTKQFDSGEETRSRAGRETPTATGIREAQATTAPLIAIMILSSSVREHSSYAGSLPECCASR